MARSRRLAYKAPVMQAIVRAKTQHDDPDRIWTRNYRYVIQSTGPPRLWFLSQANVCVTFKKTKSKNFLENSTSKCVQSHKLKWSSLTFCLTTGTRSLIFVYIYIFIETLLQRYNTNEHFTTYITWNVYTDQLAISTKAVGYTFKLLLLIIILIKVLTLIVICIIIAVHHLINIILKIIESDVSFGNCSS